ncbi:MAG: efflux RND transporter periplasmic adaptor subunit [Bacteroidota bacterium]|nr:efflux RND transporter periplasmic adaptor subunit [Bacteroidota bacterium]
MKQLILLSGLIGLLVISCKSTKEPSGEKKTESHAPVTVTHVSVGEMADVVELNAVSSFLLKTYVKANSNGYLQEVNAQPGEFVSKGKKLFVIRSKEAEHLGNTVNAVDTSFHLSGLVSIKAPGNGYITQLAYRAGDYVQDGETLATISAINSLVFLLELPYELKPYLSNNKTVELLLPDGVKLKGAMSSPLPTVDAVSQTQSYIIKVASAQAIPENLIAKVKFVRKLKAGAVSLPKESILTNEVQSEFWIMKMIDANTAVKVPVVKGIETSNRVEILSPKLSLSDKILLQGNYGLPDTAHVVIENKE